MRADPDDYTVARYLEAYLLWLFGQVMFCGSQGDVVSRDTSTNGPRTFELVSTFSPSSAAALTAAAAVVSTCSPFSATAAAEVVSTCSPFSAAAAADLPSLRFSG